MISSTTTANNRSNGLVFLSCFLLLQQLQLIQNNNLFVLGALRGGIAKAGIADDWDLACPAQADALSSCVGSSGGVLEICKGCIKMAAQLESTEFALEACAEGSYMCNGCQNNIEAYFNCGSRDGEGLVTTEENSIEGLVEYNANPNEATEAAEAGSSLGDGSAGQQQQQQQEVVFVGTVETRPVAEASSPFGDSGGTTNAASNSGDLEGTTNVPENSNSYTLQSGFRQPPPENRISGGGQEPPPANEVSGNGTSSGGGIADDWDRACPAHAYDLENCVNNNTGIIELCKSCIKMASTLDSTNFALEACAEEPSMCYGCTTTIRSYYECGKFVG